MRKILILLSLILAVTSCNDKNNSVSLAVVSLATPYLNCEAVPSGMITSHMGCPGSSGSWNNYEAKLNADGSVISIDLYCGGGDTEHPMNQSDYDGYASAGETSSGDFKISSDCVSGTRSDNASNETIANIWQKI